MSPRPTHISHPDPHIPTTTQRSIDRFEARSDERAAAGSPDHPTMADGGTSRGNVKNPAIRRIHAVRVPCLALQQQSPRPLRVVYGVCGCVWVGRSTDGARQEALGFQTLPPPSSVVGWDRAIDHQLATTTARPLTLTTLPTHTPTHTPHGNNTGHPGAAEGPERPVHRRAARGAFCVVVFDGWMQACVWGGVPTVCFQPLASLACHTHATTHVSIQQ